MTFEGTFQYAGYWHRVADYYSGNGGPNYGVVFGPSIHTSMDKDEHIILADNNSGGALYIPEAPFANEPSPSTAITVSYPPISSVRHTPDFPR
jgi:hypothetical protein